MKQIITLILFLCSWQVWAQLPSPCPSGTTPPATSCSQACIYCNFNGFNSSSSGYSSSGASFCSSVENDQWFGFINGSNVGSTFTVIPSNCANGDGLQMALYSSCGSAPIECNAGQAGGGGIPISISTTSLVVGQTYYLMVDGFAGDQCNFSVVSSPTVGISLPTPPGPIAGPPNTCANATAVYTIPIMMGASAYTWTAPAGALINGQPSPATILGNTTGNTVTITYGSASGVICVYGENSCYQSPPTCLPIVLTSNPPIQHPPVEVCPEDLPHITPWGQAVSTSGLYSNTFINSSGCVTEEFQLVTVIVTTPTVIPPVVVCGNEPFIVCGDEYLAAGTYSVTCPSTGRCDSIVNFTILTPDFDVEIQQGDTVLCPTLPFTISTLPQPLNAEVGWFLAGNPDALAKGVNAYVVTDYGTYVLQKTVPFGANKCDFYDTIYIDCPFVPADCDAPVISAFDISSTEGYVSWDADPEANLYRIQYRVQGTSNWTTIIKGGYPRNSVKLSGLLPDAVYECRVKAICSMMTSDYSNIATISTDTNDSCSEPNSMGYGYLSTGDPTKIILFCDSEPNATKYRWRIRVAGTGAYFYRRRTNAQFVLPDLLPNTTYDYSCSALCNGSWTPWLATQQFHTLSGPSPLAPPTLVQRGDQSDFEQEMQLFPNPTSGELYIAFDKSENPDFVHVYNQLGKLVMQKTILSDTERLDVVHLPTGQYVIQAGWNDGTVLVKSFVKM